jgi:TrmH family RNA methyltransferase
MNRVWEMSLLEKSITSINNQLIKDCTKLKQKKFRNLNNQYLVEGHHLVNEALMAGVLNTVFFTGNIDFEFENSYQVTEDVMRKLSSVETPQGIIGVCNKVVNQKISDRVLLLDNLQDPGNIGTLIRSCAAFGFNTIIANNTVDFFNDKVIRSSQGAIFKISLINASIIDFVKGNSDYHFIATDLKAKNDLSDFSIDNEKVGLILGNEGQGISEDLLELADAKVKIRMADMESLNVAVAGSIFMYQLTLGRK